MLDFNEVGGSSEKTHERSLEKLKGRLA